MQKLDNKTKIEALQLGAASNAEYDQMIKENKLGYDGYWTSTAVAYEKPGTPFGKTASFKSGSNTWTIAIPRKYQGKKNLVLLANISPEEVKPEGNVITLLPKKIIVKKMPEKNGWYVPDEIGFPSGKESNSGDENARRLWRMDEGHVGLLSRGYGFGCGRRDVYAYLRGDDRLGVMISNTGTSGKIGCENCKRLEKENTDLRERLAKIKDIVEAAEG